MNILPILKVERKNLGFTLVELLVVIGILGILATALIASIDPFEQIKKTTDSSVKTASIEYLNAITRYYATRNAYPWDAAPSGAGCTGVSATGALLSSVTTCTGALVTDGELKSTFSTSPHLSKIYVTYAAAAGLSVCFSPTSKSGIADASTNKYNSSGVIGGAGCPTAGVAGCYWCAK